MTQIITWESGEKRSTVILNRHFSGLLPRGIYKGFDVITNVSSLFLNLEKGSDDTSVLLTPEGVRIEEDADIPNFVSIDIGDAQPRIDLVVCTHQYTVTNDPAVYSVIKGTPAPSPVPPALPAEPPFVTLLATINVGVGVTDILPGDVTLAPKVAISLTTVPFVTLSDVSATQSDAFAAMVAPSGANPIATIADVTTTVAAKQFTRSSFDEVRVAEKGTPDANVQVLAGRLHDLRNISSADIVSVASLGPFGVTNVGEERIDLVVVDPDTQVVSIVTGVDAPPSATVPTYPLDKIVLAEIFIDESATVVINTADITDVRPIVHRNVPNFEDIPNMTTDIEDAITGAAAPDSGNVFQTADDVATAISPFTPAFVLSRLELDTSKNISGSPNTDKCRVRSSAGNELRITLHDATFVLNKLLIITADLSVDITVAAAPGGRDTTATVAVNKWYFIYMIASSSTALAPALVLSESSILPDLSGAGFTGPGYDIFRRIGSVRRDGGGLFLETFCKDGICQFLQPGVIDTSLPGGSFVFAGGINPISDFVPPTSRRATCVAEAFEDGSFAITVFAAHPDIGTGSTGGKNIISAGLAGSGNTDRETNEFGIDLDDSQRFKMRSSGSAASFNIWAVGYAELL